MAFFYNFEDSIVNQLNKMKKIINSLNAPAPVGPYNQSVLANGVLFVSGQIAIDPSVNKLVDGDIKAQAKQVMENHLAILKEAGMDFSNVVKVSLFISDMNDFSQINEVYAIYFSENSPAREAMEVAKLPLNANIMMSLVAVQDN